MATERFFQIGSVFILFRKQAKMLITDPSGEYAVKDCAEGDLIPIFGKKIKIQIEREGRKRTARKRL